MLSWTEIVQIVNERRREDTPLKRVMVAIRDRYNADYTIPLPDVEGNPRVKSLTPSLVADAIDNPARRAASVLPDILVPVLNDSELSARRAKMRKQAWLGTWRDSALFELIMPRAYRHYYGYSTFSLVVQPDYREERPKIRLRDPLMTYAEPRSPEEYRPPCNVAFVTGHSPDYIRKLYPDNREIAAWLKGIREGDLVDVVEWIDEDQCVLGLLGPRSNWLGGSHAPVDPGPLLHRVENRAGMVPAAIGAGMSMDRVTSKVWKVLGVHEMLDRLMVLDYVAVERTIFPDVWAIGRDGKPPQLLTGSQIRDGRTGQINVIVDGEVREMNSVAGPQGQQMLSMLERNFRVSSDNPGIFGGELTGSLRSGQTVNAMAGFAVDPGIAEAQRVMQYHLQTLNKAVAEVHKGYFPGKKIVFFAGTSGAGEQVELDDRIWETTENHVRYPIPGMDATGLTIGVSQLNGAGLLSKATARRLHPWIDEPTFEDDQLDIEQLEAALAAQLSQMVAQGATPIEDVARIVQLRRTGMSLTDAVLQVSEEARERQAREAETAAELQPGLGPPGAGLESQPPSPIPGPSDGLSQLRELFNATVAPTRAVNAVAPRG